jgi:hypothetical protein
MPIQMGGVAWRLMNVFFDYVLPNIEAYEKGNLNLKRNIKEKLGEKY